jgi:ABC-2 type transport system ATP-binding protein
VTGPKEREIRSNHSEGIVLRDVRFGYTRRRALWGGPARVALTCDSLVIPPGLTLLLGPNGAGKSTLLKLMAGIEAPETGHVLVDGKDLWREEIESRRSIAYVPEQPDLTPYATVGEVLRLVAALRGEPIEAGSTALARVGLGDLAHRTVRELSMGQRRRAVLAAALVGIPRVLLLDEPLEAMDRAMRETIVAWVTDRLAAGATVVVATHEIEPFTAFADRAVAIDSGVPRLIESLSRDDSHRMRELDTLARG